MKTKTIAKSTKTVAKKTNAKAAKATTTKATKKNATVTKQAAKKLSQIEAAIQILGKSKNPMNCIAMVEAMQVQGLWSTPGGATPEATLDAALASEFINRCLARIRECLQTNKQRATCSNKSIKSAGCDGCGFKKIVAKYPLFGPNEALRKKFPDLVSHFRARSRIDNRVTEIQSYQPQREIHGIPGKHN